MLMSGAVLGMEFPMEMDQERRTDDHRILTLAMLIQAGSKRRGSSEPPDR